MGGLFAIVPRSCSSSCRSHLVVMRVNYSVLLSSRKVLVLEDPRGPVSSPCPWSLTTCPRPWVSGPWQQHCPKAPCTSNCLATLCSICQFDWQQPGVAPPILRGFVLRCFCRGYAIYFYDLLVFNVTFVGFSASCFMLSCWVHLSIRKKIRTFLIHIS